MATAEDSVLIGSQRGMTIHFKANHAQLRPLGRPTKGVRAMSLRDGDRLISMDILPSQVVEEVEEAVDDTDVEPQTEDEASNTLVANVSRSLDDRIQALMRDQKPH